MSLWQPVRREVAGVTRSIRYDLRPMMSQPGRRAHRLVMVTGTLAVLTAAGLGTVWELTGSAGGPPNDPPGVTRGPDYPVPDSSGRPARPGLGGAIGATGATGISLTPGSSPTPSSSPSPSATRNKPPGPTPAPATSRPPASPSPSPTSSGSPAPSGSTSAP